LDSDFIISATDIGFDETLPNLIKRKHPRKGQPKKTRGKDQSLGKQTAQKGQATRRKGNP
jgi:hypothetical protein